MGQGHHALRSISDPVCPLGREVKEGQKGWEKTPVK